MGKCVILGRIFSICELSKVVRQDGDNEFITLLNSVRIDNTSDVDVKLLQSREVSIENLGNDVNVLFAENGTKNQYNCMKLETLKQQLVEISTIKKVPPGVTTDMLINIPN